MSEASRPDTPWCLDRRQLLLLAGGTVVSLVCPSLARGQEVKIRRRAYTRKRLVPLASLKTGAPVKFKYPDELDVFSDCLLIKLGVPAGGGVGPDKDVVAFSALCTHMGGPLDGLYKPKHQVLGPCALHQTLFDMTRHGMVVSGHATQSLPQIVLTVDSGHLVATGVQGLLYGREANLS